LEAITRVGQDPAWVVAPGWMDGCFGFISA
jgi:hypothetical protein